MGCVVGFTVGWVVGFAVGCVVGCTVGFTVGCTGTAVQLAPEQVLQVGQSLSVVQSEQPAEHDVHCVFWRYGQPEKPN